MDFAYKHGFFITFSNKNDLESLIKYTLNNISDFDKEKIANLIKALCAIDEKIYTN